MAVLMTGNLSAMSWKTEGTNASNKPEGSESAIRIGAPPESGRRSGDADPPRRRLGTVTLRRRLPIPVKRHQHITAHCLHIVIESANGAYLLPPQAWPPPSGQHQAVHPLDPAKWRHKRAPNTVLESHGNGLVPLRTGHGRHLPNLHRHGRLDVRLAITVPSTHTADAGPSPALSL